MSLSLFMIRDVGEWPLSKTEVVRSSLAADRVVGDWSLIGKLKDLSSFVGRDVKILSLSRTDVMALSLVAVDVVTGWSLANHNEVSSFWGSSWLGLESRLTAEEVSLSLSSSQK